MQLHRRKNRVWLAACVLGAAASLTCFTARRAALAQQEPAAPGAPAATGATNIAVVNVARCFAEMQATKDLKTRMDAEGRALVQQDTDRANKLKDLQSTRDMTKANTQQYEDAQKILTQGRIEYRVWVETTKAELDRRQKQQTKDLYDRIIAAVAELAKQRNIDLVFSDQKQFSPDNVDKMNIDDFRAMLGQREVLYAASRADISSDVIALLDAKFKEGK